MPGVPNLPGRRKALPKPFQRKSITISAPDVKREWQRVPASSLDLGDTVTSHGTLTAITLRRSGEVHLRFLEHALTVDGAQELFAFTRVRDGS